MITERLVDQLFQFNREMNLLPGVPRHRCEHVASILSNQGLPLNKAVNMLKTHPWLTKYTKHPFLHAESHAILKHGINNCEGLDLVVLRFSKDHEIKDKQIFKLTMSYPCSACWSMIKDVGIRRVFYSDWDGVIREWNIIRNGDSC